MPCNVVAQINLNGLNSNVAFNPNPGTPHTLFRRTRLNQTRGGEVALRRRNSSILLLAGIAVEPNLGVGVVLGVGLKRLRLSVDQRVHRIHVDGAHSMASRWWR